jgi:putative heme-binding domain-containing protein
MLTRISIPAALTALAILVQVEQRAVGAQQRDAQHPGVSNYAQADFEAGARVYAANCVGCHGANGDGVGTVNLKNGQFRRAGTDQELSALISNGIPGTGMPAHRLAPPELSALVIYVRNMRDYDGRSITLGDASRGRALFDGKAGCKECHRVAGSGPRGAPDLTDIGLTRSASQLQRSLLEPSAGMMPINRPVQLLFKDGRRMTARRLNEDTYYVQLVDQEGRLVSVDKSELREYRILVESPMPSVKGKLTTDEVSDLVAYLASLKG